MGLTSGLVERLGRPGAGLLLDLDGTLVDSEPLHRSAFDEFFASQGWQVPDDVVRQFMGRRAQEVFATLAGPWDGQDPHELTEAVVAVLRASDPRPLPVPGAREVLEACARTGLPVAVVTSARREWARGVVGQILAGVGAPVLPPMVTAEDCTHGKPDPEPYRRGAELLALDPAGLVAVEDAPAGLDSARSAGVGYLVAMASGDTTATLPSVDLVLTDLRPLAEAIARRQPSVRGS